MAEVAKAVDFLLNAANFFADPSIGPNNKPRSIKAALQCMYTALSFVLPPSREADVRMRLGELLLDFTEESQLAVEQLQKAHNLVNSVQMACTLRYLYSVRLPAIAFSSIEGMWPWLMGYWPLAHL